ncbi:glutaredoxin family protein [Kineococcus gynurae]|uniref:Glutaredoxin family protein n=1 Tax=Kineococcus gynurae TaxID=452979 RepID=A0ABV5LTQ9_9ACTN
MAAGTAPRLTLVSREGCHLCEQGRAVVERVAAAEDVGWVEVDVDTDPELRRRFTDRVPVVLVDGAERDFGWLDEERLRRALQGRRWWQRARVR